MAGYPQGYRDPFRNQNFSGLGGDRLRQTAADQQYYYNQQNQKTQHNKDQEMRMCPVQQMLTIRSEIPVVKGQVHGGGYPGVSVSGQIEGVGVIVISASSQSGEHHTELSIKNNPDSVAALHRIFTKILGDQYRAKFVASTKKVKIYRITPVT